SGGRFVEHEELGPGHEGAHETDLAPVPAGEPLRATRAVELEALAQLVHVRRVDTAASQARPRAQRLVDGQTLVQAKLARQVTDAASQCRPRGLRIRPEDTDLPTVRSGEVEQDPKR